MSLTIYPAQSLGGGCSGGGVCHGERGFWASDASVQHDYVSSSPVATSLNVGVAQREFSVVHLIVDAMSALKPGCPAKLLWGKGGEIP